MASDAKISDPKVAEISHPNVWEVLSKES